MNDHPKPEREALAAEVKRLASAWKVSFGRWYAGEDEPLREVKQARADFEAAVDRLASLPVESPASGVLPSKDQGHPAEAHESARCPDACLQAPAVNAEAAPAAAASGWRPIGTAPKDGTRLILSWGGRSCVGYWLNNAQTVAPWAGWRVPSMESRPAGQPAHWMPLPAPPSLNPEGETR